MKSRFFAVIALSLAYTVALPSWACEGAGPSTHVGKVLKVDSEKGTFTILDAQTVNPVTFHAGQDLITKVAASVGTAFVEYDSTGPDLVATSVSFR